MYLVPTEIRESPIEGRGVFAAADIPKGTIVWQFKEKHDKRIPLTEFESLSEPEKEALLRVGYSSPSTKLFVFPPANDPARYTNHSRNNNTSVAYDEAISDEPYFVANRRIRQGDEITNNYLEFDEFTKKSRPEWI